MNVLINKQNKSLPGSNSSNKLANNCGVFFTEKIQKIRDDLDHDTKSSRHSCSVNSSCDEISTDSTHAAGGSNEDTYVCTKTNIKQMSVFRNFSEDEMLEIVKKCPNKSCVLDPLPTCSF
ncbi:unnamed protein product, partial [marine sediment metagenome]